MTTTVGVVGGGVVGRATSRAWMEHADVFVYDHDPRRGGASAAEACGCDVTFVCLPETSLDRFFSGADPSAAYAIKSTVGVGDTRRLAKAHRLTRAVHCPEFLTSRCAVADAHVPARNIVGRVGAAEHPVERLLRYRFPGVPLLTMSAEESEAVKLVCNAFFAVKIAFFNEAYTMARANGLNWDSILAGVLSDGRVAHAHTRIPGPDGLRGFGGACLIKDTETFAAELDRVGLRADMSRAALGRNTEDRS